MHIPQYAEVPGIASLVVQTIHSTFRLLKRNESRVLHVGTSTVTDGLVGDTMVRRSVDVRMDDLRELSEVVTGHLWLDLDSGERLSVLPISITIIAMTEALT